MSSNVFQKHLSDLQYILPVCPSRPGYQEPVEHHKGHHGGKRPGVLVEVQEGGVLEVDGVHGHDETGSERGHVGTHALLIGHGRQRTHLKTTSKAYDEILMRRAEDIEYRKGI